MPNICLRGYVLILKSRTKILRKKNGKEVISREKVQPLSLGGRSKITFSGKNRIDLKHLDFLNLAKILI